MPTHSGEKIWSSFFVALIVSVAACGNKGTETMSDKRHFEWSEIADKKIVFAHQSVGANVLSGIERLAKADGASININDLVDGPLLPGITHFKVGRNGEPLLKLSEFAAAMEAGGGLEADIALVKLCYIDFDSKTDARQVAKEYLRTLDSLAERYPNTKFVAVTAPLTTVQTGPKAWIKRLIGREPAQYVENAKRAEFNAVLRHHFEPRERLFDLAKAEAEGGGRRAVVSVNGKEVETLDPRLTYDGGHLNVRGQEVVAAALLDYIINPAYN